MTSNKASCIILPLCALPRSSINSVMCVFQKPPKNHGMFPSYEYTNEARDAAVFWLCFRYKATTSIVPSFSNKPYTIYQKSTVNALMSAFPRLASMSHVSSFRRICATAYAVHSRLYCRYKAIIQLLIAFINGGFVDYQNTGPSWKKRTWCCCMQISGSKA